MNRLTAFAIATLLLIPATLAANDGPTCVAGKLCPENLLAVPVSHSFPLPTWTV